MEFQKYNVKEKKKKERKTKQTNKVAKVIQRREEGGRRQRWPGG